MARRGEEYIPCPNNRETRASCPFADTDDGCRTDEHHKVPQRLKREARLAFMRGEVSAEYYQTVRRYVNHPMNRVVACRWIHERVLDDAVPDELPPLEAMKAHMGSYDGA